MSIFREYDIRGVYGQDLTEAIAEQIGRAYGTYILRDAPRPLAPGAGAVAVGYDIRPSSPALREALIDGMLSTGLNVVDIGACPTPTLYFALFDLPVSGGVMITASHNPSEFNGFKLCAGSMPLSGEEIQRLCQRITQHDYAHGAGRLTVANGFLNRYADHIVARFQSHSPPQTFVMDCGNAAAALIAPEIMRRLGHTVIPLYCEPDGRFPNHHPDPTVPQNMKDLIAEVKRQGADLGVGFDGDADRLGVVDEQGRLIGGDYLTLLFATDILKKHPGSTIISEVKASQVLYDEIARLGGVAIMWKAGHSLIKKKMKETGALLGGEVSGHLFFRDRHEGYDDAIYAACRLLEMTSGHPLSSYFSHLPECVATPEIRVDCADDLKFKVVEQCKAYFGTRYPTLDVDGVRILFEGGWGLIRASNTQPALVLRFEARNPAQLKEFEQRTRRDLAGIFQNGV